MAVAADPTVAVGDAAGVGVHAGATLTDVAVSAATVDPCVGWVVGVGSSPGLQPTKMARLTIASAAANPAARIDFVVSFIPSRT